MKYTRWNWKYTVNLRFRSFNYKFNHSLNGSLHNVNRDRQSLWENIFIGGATFFLNLAYRSLIFMRDSSKDVKSRNDVPGAI